MNNSISAFIEIEIDDYKGMYFCEEFEVEANYDFQPYEPEVRYYPDGSGYPGCAAQVEGIYDIICIDKDQNKVKLFIEILEIELKQIEDKIESSIWDYLQSYDERDY